MPVILNCTYAINLDHVCKMVLQSNSIKVPENRARNLAEDEAINVWKETGMLLVKNFLPNDVIDGLHEYAMTKIADGADPGDHFRTTAIKTGYEGRGWAQRAALWPKRPDLLGSFSNQDTRSKIGNFFENYKSEIIISLKETPTAHFRTDINNNRDSI